MCIESGRECWCHKQEKKRILDVCCGGKMMWFDKENPHVLFSDIRQKPKGTIAKQKGWSIEPDEINDFRQLPYPDNSFQMVVFDPPHILRKIPERGILPMQYGVLHPDTWRDDLKKGLDECWRVLMNEGVLVFKWNEQQKKLSELIDLFPTQPLFGHPSGSKSQTLWVCFMKIHEEPKA